jgi:hypothetical protein
MSLFHTESPFEYHHLFNNLNPESAAQADILTETPQAQLAGAESAISPQGDNKPEIAVFAEPYNEREHTPAPKLQLTSVPHASSLSEAGDGMVNLDQLIGPPASTPDEAAIKTPHTEMMAPTITEAPIDTTSSPELVPAALHETAARASLEEALAMLGPAQKPAAERRAFINGKPNNPLPFRHPPTVEQAAPAA